MKVLPFRIFLEMIFPNIRDKEETSHFIEKKLSPYCTMECNNYQLCFVLYKHKNEYYLHI